MTPVSRRKKTDKLVERFCLKCDKKIKTLPQFRLCANCNAVNSGAGMDSGYEILSSAGRRISTQFVLG